jgi:hypothetical protein
LISIFVLQICVAPLVVVFDLNHLFCNCSQQINLGHEFSQAYFRSHTSKILLYFVKVCVS